MAKTRSGKRFNDLCNNVPSKNTRNTKNYSATDKVKYNRTKVVGLRKSEGNVPKRSDVERMKKYWKNIKYKKSKYSEYIEKERIRGKINRELDAAKRNNDPELLIKYKEKETLRKQDQRAKKKSKRENINKQKADHRKRQQIGNYKN